jgi:hypothetical protein
MMNIAKNMAQRRVPEGCVRRRGEGGRVRRLHDNIVSRPVDIFSEAIILENHDTEGSGAMVVVRKRREGKKKIKRISTSFGPFQGSPDDSC